MKKEFEFAAIFSASDVKDGFISCIASIMNDCDETTILVESQNGIDRIAEVYITCESGEQRLSLQIHEDAARQYNIDAEATEVLFNIAAIIRSNTRTSIEESLNIAMAIAENYTISHK